MVWREYSLKVSGEGEEWRRGEIYWISSTILLMRAIEVSRGSTRAVKQGRNPVR